jgi:hypothetical protein
MALPKDLAKGLMVDERYQDCCHMETGWMKDLVRLRCGVSVTIIPVPRFSYIGYEQQNYGCGDAYWPAITLVKLNA